MARVNIYIRKEDEEKWEAIENKPEWLSMHINMLPHQIGKYEHADTLNEYFSKNKPKVTPITAGVKGSKYCEHYQTKGECLVKGCKYSK